MKSLMKIYVKYIAAALTTILAFILLQLVILGVVTAKSMEAAIITENTP